MNGLTKEKFEQGFKLNETCKAFDLNGAQAINFFQQFFFFDDMEEIFGEDFVEKYSENKITAVEINEENRYKTTTVFRNGDTLMIDAKQLTFMDFEYEIEFKPKNAKSNEGAE